MQATALGSPAILLILLSSSLAVADDEIHTATTSSEPSSRHLVYAELFGKAGEYGVGYELTIAPWLAIGGAGSFAQVQGQQIVTLAPYLHATIVERGPHALYTELGAILAHSRIPSPVPDWDGMSKSGAGGFLSLGYQHARRHLVLRGSLSVAAGEGGIAPMAGLSIGVRP